MSEKMTAISKSLETPENLSTMKDFATALFVALAIWGTWGTDNPELANEALSHLKIPTRNTCDDNGAADPLIIN